MLSDDLKHDLKAAVGGLNSLLSSLQDSVHRQREQWAAFAEDRAHFIQQLKELKPLAELARCQQSEISTLRQVFIYLVTAQACSSSSSSSSSSAAAAASIVISAAPTTRRTHAHYELFTVKRTKTIKIKTAGNKNIVNDVQ